MNKAHLNYFIDLLMLIVGSIVAITGVLKLPILKSIYQTLNVRTITQLHDISGIIIIILVIIHLALHWTWIVSMTKSIFKRKVKTNNQN
jgi:hypothetical protein